MSSNTSSSTQANPSTAQPLDQLTPKLSEADQTLLQRKDPVVTNQNSQFTGQILANASVETAWDVLTDYRRFADFLPTVTASRVLEADGNRKVVEQIDARKVLFAEVESRVCTENIEKAPNRIDFQLLEGDLKTLQGQWRVAPVTTEPSGDRPQVLITQEVEAEADAGLFEGAFHSIFESSLKENLTAIQTEVEQRSLR